MCSSDKSKFQCIDLELDFSDDICKVSGDLDLNIIWFEGLFGDRRSKHGILNFQLESWNFIGKQKCVTAQMLSHRMPHFDQ